MRPANTDFLQGFRYHVIASDANDADPLQPTVQSDREHHGAGGQAGFQSVTIPEISVEASEYREGTFKYTQKYPGPPTVSEFTLMQGVTKQNTAFHDMVMASVDGEEYRADVRIYHYQRTEMDQATSATVADDIRRLECKECFAIRAKAMGDLDSMAGDISLAEVDLACESFEVKYS